MKTSKNEWIVFLALAYGMTILMAIPLGICQRAGYDTNTFPIAQMMYPAAGVILSAMLFGSKRDMLPKRYFAFYLIITAVLVVMSVASVLAPQTGWYMIANNFVMAASVLAWIFLLSEKKEKREAFGLRWHGGVLVPVAIMLVFIATKVISVIVSLVISGGVGEYLEYLATPTPWVTLVILIPNFFLSFIIFFGEEYGWRYWLQPRLQQRFGMRLGVIVLGVVWGLWHLPLNAFFYSPETTLQSIAAQLITCISLGVFFAFAYLKTNNIWVPVILHYLNNNLIVVISGSADFSNQVYAWGDILLVFVLDVVIYMPFLLSKAFRKPVQKPEIPEK